MAEAGGEAAASADAAGADDEPQAADPGAPLEDGALNPASRGCTDIAMCLVFLAAVVALGVLHGEAFKRGDARKVTRPLDHAGRSCGLGDRKAYPYVYYPTKPGITDALGMSGMDPRNHWGVCTKACPTEASAHSSSMCHPSDNSSCTWYSKEGAVLVLDRFCVTFKKGQEPDHQGVHCEDPRKAVANMSAELEARLAEGETLLGEELATMEAGITNETTKKVMRKSMGRLLRKERSRRSEAKTMILATSARLASVKSCVDETTETRKGVLAGPFVGDILSSKWVLMFCGIACLIFGIVYLLLVTFFVRIVVWASLLTLLVGFVYFGIKFWKGSIQVDSMGLVEDGTEEIVVAVICWVAALPVFIILAFYRRQLDTAIKLCQATCVFIMQNFGLFVLPYVTGTLQILWLAYWGLTLASLLSVAEVLPAEDMTQEANRIKFSTELKYALAYHLFLGLWVLNLFGGIPTVATSITVSQWYFSAERGGCCSCFTGLLKTLRYHLGSIAVGAMLLAFVQFLRVCAFLFEQAARGVGRNNPVTQTIARIVQYLLMCIEKIVRSMNEMSYVMIGITGNNICTSAFQGVQVVLRNPVQFAMFKSIMWTISLLGRLSIMCVSLLLGNLMLAKVILPEYTSEVSKPWPGLVTVAVLSYFVAGIMIEVYTTSGTAVFFCFILDKEAAEKAGRAVNEHAPESLKALVAEKTDPNKAEEKKEE